MLLSSNDETTRPRELRVAPLQRGLVRVFLLAIAYIVAVRFFTPGFFEPLVPSHSDAWRYFSTSQQIFHWSLLKYPRPVMFFVFRIFGITSQFDLFMSGVLGVALLLPLVMLSTCERLTKVSVGYGGAFLYFLAVFSLVTFYQLQTLDFGGCLSVILLCFAVIAADAGLRAQQFGLARAGSIVLLCWLAMEAKLTYAAVMPLVPALFYGRADRRKLMGAAIGLGFIVIAVMLKDKLLGSPFIDTTNNTQSAYHVSARFSELAAGVWFYLKHLTPVGLLPLLAAAGISFALRRGWLSLAALCILSVCAFLPVTVLPNNRVPMYSWFGSVVLFLPLAYLRWQKSAGNSGSVVFAAAGQLLLVVAGLTAIAKWMPDERGWLSSNQWANGNTLNAIAALKAEIHPGERVLFAGPLNAYSPLKDDEFLSLQFPYAFSWKVAIHQADSPLIQMQNASTRLMLAHDVDLGDFDSIAYFDGNGNLLRYAPAAALQAKDRAAVIASLLCHAIPASDLEAINGCLASLGEQVRIVRPVSTGGPEI